MQFGIKQTLLRRTRLRENVIKFYKGDIRSASIGFRLGQEGTQIRAVKPLAKLTPALDALTHFCQFGLPVASGPICPPAKEAASTLPYGHAPRIREVENGFRKR